jgi:hypothetical protein
MQSAVALNVQQSIRPGECIDTYYAGIENSRKQCHATVEDNRFFISLPSLASGSSSTVTFNPNEGLAEVIVTLQLPAPLTGQGLAVPEGWGYQMIRRIGYRYGSSQLYYISGAQSLLESLSLCEDSGKKQQMFFLGGQALLSPADWADAGKRTAYVYLRLPHSSPALSGGAFPFPTDVLTAPVQIELQLQDFNRVISAVTVAGTPPDAVPTQLASASVNFTQVTMQDSGDLVARRFDMSTNALTIPLHDGWCQEEIQLPFTSGVDGSFQLSLTGCKAGDLRKLRIWFTKPTDTPGGATALNLQSKWYAPSQVTFAINGLIYLDSRNGSWLLSTLLRRRQPPVVTYSDLTAPVAVGGGYGAAPFPSAWLEIDLGQPHTLGDSQEVALIHGVPVMNSVMNLTGTMPEGVQGYVCHVEYVLNCSWMASRGSAEFIF